jgi:hypothetical protein
MICALVYNVRIPVAGEALAPVAWRDPAALRLKQDYGQPDVE